MWYIIITSIITALATVSLTTVFYYFKEKKLYRKQMQLELLGDLMGNIQLLRQLYTSRFEAYIDSNFYEYLWHRQPNEDLYKEEAKRLARTVENLAIEIARTRKIFFATVYRLPLVFQLDDDTKGTLEKLKCHKTPVIKDFPDGLTIEQLKEAEQQAKKDLHRIIDEELYQPTNTVYQYLESKASY